MDHRSRPGRIVLGAVIGTILEAYDFVVYGFAVTYVATAVFPAKTGLVAILLATATFGAGFVMRPLGALLLGGYIDRAGRRAGLSLTLMLMAAGTLIVGATPSFAIIGVASPILLVVGRLLQGFSIGGELGGATAILVEQADPQQRGAVTSLQQVSVGLSVLLGSAVTALVAALLPSAAMAAWGWRVPILLGLLIVPVGIALRASLPACRMAGDGAQSAVRPVRETVSRHRLALVRGFGLVAAGTASIYVLLVFMPTFAIRELKLAAPAALAINAGGVIFYTLAAWLVGRWSDQVGRRRAMLASGIALLILILPLFVLLIERPSPVSLLVVQLVLGMLAGAYSGPLMAMVGEVFPARVRATGVAIAYSGAVTIFGGLAPFTVTWLVAATGSKIAPACYVLALTLVGIAALAHADEHDRRMSAV